MYDVDRLLSAGRSTVHLGRSQWVLGDRLYEQGRLPEALGAYRAAIGTLGGHYQLMTEVGKKLILSGKHDAARFILHQAWRDEPSVAVAPARHRAWHSRPGGEGRRVACILPPVRGGPTARPTTGVVVPCPQTGHGRPVACTLGSRRSGCRREEAPVAEDAVTARA